jgi:hypothetical protein
MLSYRSNNVLSFSEAAERLMARSVPPAVLDMPPEPASPEPEEAAERPKQVRRRPVYRERQAGYDGAAVIVVLADGNPKRPKSRPHAFFNMYSPGITVAQYRVAVGSRADDCIKWDIQHGFIKLVL